MLLTIQTVAKAYGDNQVLNNVTFTLDHGQKLGLVGANGVGKSTLLKIIVGEIEADGGAVRIAAGVSVGYLPQVLTAAANQTIAGLLDASQDYLTMLEQKMRALEQRMVDPDGDLTALLREYSELTHQFEAGGGYDWAHRVELVLAGLGIDYLPHTRPVATLSGGEKARVGLAALLLGAPNLLLLDEPTNHLDFAALAWLEGYLQNFRGGLLVVSHDRQFLNQTVQAIVEIDEHSKEARHYAGTYDFYAEIKRRERAQWIEQYWAQQEEIGALRKLIKTKANQNAFARAPRDNDKFAYTFKTEKLQSSLARNVRAAEEKLRRIEAEPILKPPQELTINSEFDPQVLESKTPLIVSAVSKAYGGQTVLDAVSCTVEPHSRIVILGANGAGKSTLLKIMAGLATADTGCVQLAPGAIIGYLDQEQETLAGKESVFAAYTAGRNGDWETLKAELLGYGLFRYPELRKPVSTLSVGQKRKLQLARLIAQRANLLLLDEPTNHISLDVLEEFEQALLHFPGPIIAISHDRRFIERFADQIWTMENGRIGKRDTGNGIRD
ncbi:MAG: ATP-binding cassette domain-containing protein [Chloroflexota bacterium]|nr:ATP-binding cassette domain-containing protein [Chloroflexota bacterium]